MIFNGIIYGKTIRLRSVDICDAEATLAIRMNSEAQKYLTRIEESISLQRDFIIKQRNKVGDYLFVAEDYNGKIVGMRRINELSEDGTKCQTGSLIGIGNVVQNTELTLIGYDFAFQVLGVNSIEMVVHENNINVISNQKRLGAVELFRKFNEDFDAYFIWHRLERSIYSKKRKEIYNLIERFA